MRFLICIFLFISAAAYGQDTIRMQLSSLDSLSTLTITHKNKDTLRVQLLNDYARLCLYDQNFLEGLKALNEARSLSKSLSYHRGEGHYFINLSIFNQLAISKSDKIRAASLNDPLAIYHHVIGNTILQSNSNFNLFGSISMPLIIDRVHGIDTTLTRLDKALNHFESQNIQEIAANIHFALAMNLSASNKLKSNQHRELAKASFQKVGQSYLELVLVLNKIRELWIADRGEEAKQLELEVVNIYAQEKDKLNKALCAGYIGRVYSNTNRPILGLEYLFQAADLLKELNQKDILRNMYLRIASVYEWSLSNSGKALEYGQYALAIRQELGYYQGVEFDYLLVTTSMINLHQIDELPAEYKDYLKTKPGRMTWFDAEVKCVLGQALYAQGNYEEALQAFTEALRIYLDLGDRRGGSAANLWLARVYQKTGDMVNAKEFVSKAFDLASNNVSEYTQIKASDLLTELYEQSGEFLKAYESLKVSVNLKAKNEALNNAMRLSELEVQAVLKKRQQEIDTLENESLLRQQENKTQRLWIFSIAVALISMVALAVILFRNSKQKERTNKNLGEALSHLKSTQSQLIQSEKMASLGELTAGIAHEIQNPLNFVNNFSEVNTELIKEILDERRKTQDNRDEDLEIDLLKDISLNQEKISHHGKRAADIVKGMLQHSRSSSGVKEPTDINALTDEYLRLAYHGLRAKDKSFNATMKTDFDESIGNINIIPQDIGRVILNLITNAFYVVNEKATLRQAQGDSYEPTVSVSTKKEGSKVLISVKDNGNGIPENIKEKIFQPFFTTKPTGQGTGLGLSLSYDIVKAHGGELTVETSINEGSLFVIHLPIKKSE